MILSQILSLLILLILAVIIVKIILDYGDTIIKIILHLITGWVMLFIANLIPGIYVPVNLLTLIISGFGGVLGTIVLILYYLLI